MALEALLNGAIDYAGLYPPAGLPLAQAAANYESYRRSPEHWMLGRFVGPAAAVDQLPDKLDWHFSVVSEREHPRADSYEVKRVMKLSRPTYCEVPLNELAGVAAIGAWGKIRCGGDAVPSNEEVAEFIRECARLRLPFKATAGLHHAMRTDEMHGFINVLTAAVLAWHGFEDRLEAVIAERDPAAFSFNGDGRWRDVRVKGTEIRAARREFIHAIGSCSFVEPVQDLEELGWLAYAR
ncbi:MAG: hypothetical protein K2Q23_04780 [Bryobacteraceae bacterium]|nr:hypothetical protein [Bryobacteraceae bacterium]